MNWQTFLNQLNAEYKALNIDNPRVEICHATTGNKFNIEYIYSDNGIICIDVSLADD